MSFFAQLFEAFDTNKDMILSWKEIYDANILELLGDFPFLLPENVDEQLEKPKDWQDTYKPEAAHYEASHHEHNELWCVSLEQYYVCIFGWYVMSDSQL